MIRIGAPSKIELDEVWRNLQNWFAQFDDLYVLTSGGVDSTLLLVAALAGRRECGCVFAVTADSPSLSRREFEDVSLFVSHLSVEHIILPTAELNDPSYRANLGDRCYFCKSALYTAVYALLDSSIGCVNKNSTKSFVVVDGTNVDDLSDHRPSLPASKEFGIRQPFLELGIGKRTIRALAALHNLPTALKPAMACLSSRIQDSIVVCREKLVMIEAAEAILSEIGCSTLRVRYHESGAGDFLQRIARIEVDRSDIQSVAAWSKLDHLVDDIRKLGFHQVTLDLVGYRKGGRAKSPTGSIGESP